MWPDRRLLELFGIEHPIILSPMGLHTTPELAAAVSAAGALGGFGTWGLPIAEWQRRVGATRQLTNRPFNLNFPAHQPPVADAAMAARMRERLTPYYEAQGMGPVPVPVDPVPSFDDAMLAAVLELRMPIVSFHFGLPKPAAVKALKAGGARLICSATTSQEAKRLENEGADVIIAQGHDAGGHRGTFAASFAEGQIGTMALVPQVVDAVQVPVIAAGGIADGRGIAAALMLGAAGVQMGTAFLSCPEAAVDPLQRQRLATPGQTTRVTRLLSGRPARALSNRYLEEMAPHEDEALAFPLQFSLVMPLGMTAAKAGSADLLPMFAGQAVGLSRAMPAATLVETLVREATQRLNPSPPR